MISFIRKSCPACDQPLVIEQGEKSETLKLMCKNKSCVGTQLKRLQKGIIALEIRGLGPKVIEKLLNAGITSSLDLFDPEKFNETTLISSGEFRKGRALEKIMTSVKSTKSIPIQKAILSLQIEDIGKTFSERIGRKLSLLDVDFSGLQTNIREQLDIEDSELNKTITDALDKFEEFGVEIIKITPPKKLNIKKKINKIVDVSGFEDRSEVLSIIEKLEWDERPINEDTQLLIVPDKNTQSTKVDTAKELGVKIMTLKQIKLLFV